MKPNAVNDQTLYWTEYGIPIRNLWHMLLYAWNEVPLAGAVSMVDIEHAPTLDALFASILLKLTQQRLRIGLGRDYQTETQLLHGIRGRIDFTESLKRNTFEHGQAICEFQPYSLNIPKNQIIRSTLLRLIQTGNFGPRLDIAGSLRHNLRWTARLLSEVDLIELDVDFIRRQQAERNDRDYRLMLAICELIAQRQMPTNVSGNHSLPSVENDALVLHHIYERFVANFYRTHLTGWVTTSQKLIRWHERNETKYLPSMKPDLFLTERSSGRMLILDTKFTADSLKENPWGTEKFDTSHLYQLYAYLKTQEHLSDQHAQTSGILLYPCVNDRQLSEKVELQGHTLRIETIDLTKHWAEIEECLLGLVLKEH